ncbi:MAG: endonuclease NucS domain-containing protein [Balneola sp.]
MVQYTKVDISETQLEDLIRRSPQLVEEDLAYIDHQFFTSRGPLDVLFKDAGNSLVVAELKVVENDAMLGQGIDYYDYVNRNIEGFTRAYQKHEIDPSQELRLMLIAPSFSIQLLNRIKWIDIPTTLITYQCIKLEGKEEIIPVFKEVNPPSLPEKIRTYTIDEKYNYIKDSESKRLAKWVVANIQGWAPSKINPEPLKHAISIKYEGRVLAYIDPTRQNFKLGTYNAEGEWIRVVIDQKEDFDNALPILEQHFRQLSK